MEYEEFCTLGTIQAYPECPDEVKANHIESMNRLCPDGNIDEDMIAGMYWPDRIDGSSVEGIDRLQQYDNIDRVMITGLRQDTFEYFVKTFGHKISCINFDGNKSVTDLSPLSALTGVRYIRFGLNYRVTALWDMTSNHNLEGLALTGFTKLHSLEGVQAAPNLQHLRWGGEMWDTSTLTDLRPLIHTTLVSFGFFGKKIEDNDVSVFAKIPTLRILDTALNFYTTEELAQIVALCPHVSGRALAPYEKIGDIEEIEKIGLGGNVYICGKRKPVLHAIKDAAKIEEYVARFNELVEHYRRRSEISRSGD